MLPDQAHFSEEYPHLFIPGKPKQRRAPRKPPKGKRRVFFNYGDFKKGDLRERAESVRTASLSKKRIYDDQRLYFVMQFSEPVTYGVIRSILQSLGGSIVSTYAEKGVKLAVQIPDYKRFVDALEENRRFVTDIRESSGTEKLDAKLAEQLQREPSREQNIVIEVADFGGIKNARSIEEALRSYLIGRGGSVELSYLSDSFVLFTAKLTPTVAFDLADGLELVDRVTIEPRVLLVSSVGGPPRVVGLASVISLTRPSASTLPIACIIDSGVNRSHNVLREYIVETFDFSTGLPTPSSDDDGHGTMVAGVLIYGGSLHTHTDPLAKVISVKGFRDRMSPIRDPIELIDKSTGYFMGKAKVFNASFAGDAPNGPLTKALDDIIYKRDVSVVTCAGNISILEIKGHLDSREAFPNYLSSHHIFFPGDSTNSITVGSYASSPSNTFRKDAPSPFTRAGFDPKNIKPELVEDGGNLNVVLGEGRILDLNCATVGIRSASFQNNQELLEDAGTSFSAPVVSALVARIREKYNQGSAFLAKAMLLSSCSSLLDEAGKPYERLVQGFGRPDSYSCLNSTRWQASYLLQGTFDGTDPLEFHNYSFVFPDRADRLKITLACGKPAESKGYITFRLRKAGLKLTSLTKIKNHIGPNTISSTYQGLLPVVRGGRGRWNLDILPHFDQTPGHDNSLKYGGVVTVESSRHLDVYTPVAKWVAAGTKVPQAKQLLPQAQKPAVIVQ
jgi:Subtilase family